MRAVRNVAGGIAGIRTVGLLDAIVAPYRGFHALLGMNRDQCVNVMHVGYAPVRR